MQQLLYDEAPYHVLFYDAALSAWRTDQFGGWPLSPEKGGLPFFAYGTAGYDYLTGTAAAAPSPSASAARVRGGLAGCVAGRGRHDARAERVDRQLDHQRERQHPAAGRRDRPRHRGGRRGRRHCAGDGAPPARKSDRGATPIRRRIAITRTDHGVSLPAAPDPPGDADHRRDRRAQLHPVPGDAGVAGADVAQPQPVRAGAGRPPGALGSGPAALPGPVRPVRLDDHPGRLRAVVQVQGPGRDRGHRQSRLADAHPVRSRRADRDRGRPRPGRVQRLETRRCRRLRRQRHRR